MEETTMLEEKYGDNLKNLSDTQLRELVSLIAQAAGADSKKAAYLLGDTDMLRKVISAMSPKQAEDLLKTAGKEKSEEIYRILNGR
jgi:hypothetical protein